MNRHHADGTICYETHHQPGVHLGVLRRPAFEEHFLTITPEVGASADQLFAKAADVLRQRNAQPVFQDVLGVSDEGGAGTTAQAKAFGEVTWPVTWIDSGHQAGLGGTQIWAVSGLPLEPVRVDGELVGMRFEDDDAIYMRLAGLIPSDLSLSRPDQSAQVFEKMMAALRTADMDFSHVVRTWFNNDDILSWYREFNQVRTAFFKEHGVFDGLVPASTGVAGHNPRGAALVSGLLALKPKRPTVHAQALPSPLQCPALAYGSSFSRAVEVALPGHRRVLISGTASIDPDGHTVHLGNVEKQTDLTMDVAEAILRSRGMSWHHVTRGIVYFKYAKDAHAYEEYLLDKDIPALPAVVVNVDICRSDLLYEIELEAVCVD